MRRELDRVLEGIPGVEYEVDFMAVPNSSPFETPFAERIRGATARALGMDHIEMVPSSHRLHGLQVHAQPWGCDLWLQRSPP